MENPKPYVFISYAHEDAGFAEGLAKRLSQAGISYFRDTEFIDWGEDIPDSVHAALAAATHLMVLISPGSDRSQWVAYEMGYARGKEIVLVPYLLHPSMKVPGFITSVRYLKTRNEERKFIVSLQDGLKRTAKSPKGKRIRGDSQSISDTSRTVSDALKNARSINPQVRQDAIDVLVENHASSEMMALLDHRSPGVRSSAAWGLARLRHGPALRYLLEGLRYTSRQSKTAVIPQVEAYFILYGQEGLDFLLDNIPKQLDPYREGERWVRALTNTVDEENIHVLLRRASATGRREFLEAAIGSGLPLRRSDLEGAIDAYVSSNIRDLHYAHANVAEWSLNSHSQQTERWILAVIGRWVAADVQQYGARAKSYEWWSTERLVKAALVLGAVTPTELARISNETQNLDLKESLEEIGYQWTAVRSQRGARKRAP